MRQLQTTENNFLDRLNDDMSRDERKSLADEVVTHLHDNGFIFGRHGEEVNDDKATKFVMLFFQGVLRKRRNVHGD